MKDGKPDDWGAKSRRAGAAVVALVAALGLTGGLASAQAPGGGGGRMGPADDKGPNLAPTFTFDPSQKSGPQGTSWAEMPQLPAIAGDWFTDNASFGKIQQTSDSPDPKNPNVAPLLKKWWDYRMINKVENKGLNGGGAKNNAASCVPDGMPGIMSLPLGYEFSVDPGRVMILSQNGEVRRIWTDGRPHPDDPDEKFEGDSIGYWKNGVLYVDTIAILPAAEMFVGMPDSEKSHVLERMFLKTPKKLEIDTIVIDPDRLSAPFRYVRTYDRDTSMEEEICQENNRDNNGTIDLTPPPP